MIDNKIAISLKLIRNPTIKPAPRSKLRREHPDPRSVADLVNLVEQVHDVEPRFERPPAGNLERVLDADVHGRVSRQLARVRKAIAQAAAVKQIGVGLRPLPGVGGAGGCRPMLLVVEVDPVV